MHLGLNGAYFLHFQDAEDEVQALEADLNHIRWCIASVQRSIAALPPQPPPARPIIVGTATLGAGDSCLLDTERSLDAVDADMRAHGYRWAAWAVFQKASMPVRSVRSIVCIQHVTHP